MADESDEISADDWGAALAEQAAGVTDPEPAVGSGAHVATEAPPQPHVFETFGTSAPEGAGGGSDLDLIMDIPVQLTVELGRAKMPIKNLLQLAQGSVVELSGMAGEPLDVLINGFLIAQGEVVVVNEKFGIRLTDIITPSERMRRLSR